MNLVPEAADPSIFLTTLCEALSTVISRVESEFDF